MSAAVGDERRGANSGPGERGRALPGARGRPGNLQYVQPQYRAATPLPPAGNAAGADQQEKEAQIRKLNEKTAAMNEPPEENRIRRSGDGDGTHRSKKEDIFADYEEEEKFGQTTEEAATGEGVQAAAEAAVEENTQVVANAATEAQPETAQSAKPAEMPQPAAPTAPELPKTEATPDTQTKSVPEPKKGGCCVIQ